MEDTDRPKCIIIGSTGLGREAAMKALTERASFGIVFLDFSKPRAPEKPDKCPRCGRETKLLYIEDEEWTCNKCFRF
jgi:ribosomal protein S27AE